MSVRRALVDCVVLSLQDSCVLYPCCRGCFSRMQQTARWHCSRCCYSCLEQHLDYRYRLSLRVTRDNTIFGVTVFGSCLNPLFGATATHLHRLVEVSLGPRGGEGQRSGCQSRLLVKAVEDCFIGRHFVFGIKISGPLPYRTESGQFIASQISLPLASASGCSVVSYYRTLVQQAALCADSTTDPRPAPQPNAETCTAPLLLHPSPLCSFNSTLPSCGRSLSLHHTLTLTPTPNYIHTAPWQQSPGVITSSAEPEEEGCSFEGGGEVTGRQRDPAVSWWLTVCEEGEDRVSSSPHRPSHGEGGQSRNSSQGEGDSFCEDPDSPVHPPDTLTWTVPTQPGHIRTVPSSLSKRGVSDMEDEYRSVCEQTCLSDCVAWEDLPFSECLGEFVCDPADTATRTPTDHQAQTSPVWRNLSNTLTDTESSPTSHRTLLDITNVGQLTNRGRSPRSHTHIPGHLPGHTADLEEEYNCSADLFNCSQTSIKTHTPHTDSHTPHTDSHTPHTDSHTPHTDSHKPHTDSHTPHTDSHTPHTDSHTPYTDSHTPYTDSHTPYTDSHTPYTDSHTPYMDSHMDTPSECCDCFPLSQSSPIIRKTASPHTKRPRPRQPEPRPRQPEPRPRQPEPRPRQPEPRPRQPEPRDYVLARLKRRALRRTPEGRSNSSVNVCEGTLSVCDDSSEMVISPTQRPWCSRRTDRQRTGGEGENRGRTTGGEGENRGRTTGGEGENRGRTTGGEGENRGRTTGGEGENKGRTTGGEGENRRSTHIHQTLRERQTEGLANQQPVDSRCVSPSSHEENEVCDWSRDLFTDSF